MEGIALVDHSRRSFLKRASAGAAVAGAAAVVPGVFGGGVAQAETESSAPAHDEAFVAWVKDPKAGVIAVLVGEKELTYTDKKLAKRLAQVAARAHRS